MSVGFGKELLKILVIPGKILNDNISHWLDVLVNDYLKNLKQATKKHRWSENSIALPLFPVSDDSSEDYIREVIRALKTDKSGGALKFAEIKEVANLSDENIPWLLEIFRVTALSLTGQVDPKTLLYDPWEAWSRIVRGQIDWSKSTNRDPREILAAISLISLRQRGKDLGKDRLGNLYREL